METIIKTNLAVSPVTSPQVKKLDLAKFYALLEEIRFGVTPVFLTIVACLGGFAAAIAVDRSIMMFIPVIVLTGAVEALLIAVMPMKYTFWFVVLAILFDLFVFFA